jgi:NTP pyrophosphatase (non-canonical NTP hydrolase)
MTFNDYQKLAQETAIYPLQYRAVYPALGLVEEAGEVAGKVKKMLRDKPYLHAYLLLRQQPEPEHQVEFDQLKEAIKKELGDVLWYIAAVCSDFDLSMEDVAKANYQKLKDRQQRGVLGGSGDNR